MQVYIRAKMQRARHKSLPGREYHRAAAVFRTCVDGVLYGVGIIDIFGVDSSERHDVVVGAIGLSIAAAEES